MLRALGTASLVIGIGITLTPAAEAHPMLPLFKNCKEAHKAGVYNIPKGDPQYKKKQDPHHKGIACPGHPKAKKGDEPAPPDDSELPPPEQP